MFIFIFLSPLGISSQDPVHTFPALNLVTFFHVSKRERELSVIYVREFERDQFLKRDFERVA